MVIKDFWLGYLCVGLLFAVFVWNLFSLTGAVNALWWVNLIVTVFMACLLCLDFYILGKANGKRKLFETLEE